MKPLPLLLTLVALALVGAIALIQLKSPPPEDEHSQLTPVPPAPLPLDFEEPPLPLPTPPLLEENLVPDQKLLAFVENFLHLKFEQSPVFTPAPADEVITIIENGITTSLTKEQLKELNTTAHSLGILQTFQLVEHNLVTILAAEIRGLVTPQQNLILNDFVSSSPPEQAALVNLLAQRLLLQKFPFPDSKASIDAILARHLTVQSLAYATEQEFRKTLPDYEASLNENLRESILVGLPAFFHELATFGEHNIIKKLPQVEPQKIIQQLSQPSPSPSHTLLTYPFPSQTPPQTSDLGAIPLYILLLQSADPTTARTLATALIGDQTTIDENGFQWTLDFASEKSPPRAAEFLRSYYSLRDHDKRVRLEVDQTQLRILVQAPPQ